MRRLMVSLVASLTLLLVVAGPASAADEMGLSRDGVTFTQNLSGPLFDEDIRWVPSDVRSATFFVRNQGKAPALLTVDVLGAQMTELRDSGDLRVTASSGGSSLTVNDAAERRLLTLPDIADRQVVPVTITVSFDEGSTNETQLLSSDLKFQVNLRQTGAVLGEGVGDGDNGGGDGSIGGDDGGDDDSGLLPDTGGPAPWWVAALAAVAVGSGSALLISRRTHTQRTHTQGASHG